MVNTFAVPSLVLHVYIWKAGRENKGGASLQGSGSRGRGGRMARAQMAGRGGDQGR